MNKDNKKPPSREAFKRVINRQRANDMLAYLSATVYVSGRYLEALIPLLERVIEEGLSDGKEELKKLAHLKPSKEVTFTRRSKASQISQLRREVAEYDDGRECEKEESGQ